MAINARESVCSPFVIRARTVRGDMIPIGTEVALDIYEAGDMARRRWPAYIIQPVAWDDVAPNDRLLALEVDRQSHASFNLYIGVLL